MIPKLSHWVALDASQGQNEEGAYPINPRKSGTCSSTSF